MTAITFDTLKYVKTLKSAGFEERQAEAMAEVQKEILATNNIDDLVTKEDMARSLKELKLEMAAEIAPLKWGMAVTVAGIIAIILKTFFVH
ncbi:MAG: DUF1640 domain-containing protein [Magnetococcales bacterium]|nr:DUF1640 domain-containing protein [Magnetococcales bacterium]